VSEEEIDEEDIESYLGNKLPEYMLPSKLKRIEEIPLTSNGKIDKKGLPEVEFRNEENYVEARNELERKMCEIWEEVLGIDKVGIKDDFFRLGGHSLLAIRLINRINSEYNKKINIGAIFEYKKINSFSIFLSNQIDRNDKGQIFKFKK
jgi:acyl carrier protein